MSFCTQCGQQLSEGQACGCTEKLFCTQCGSPLLGGPVCECTTKLNFDGLEDESPSPDLEPEFVPFKDTEIDEHPEPLQTADEYEYAVPESIMNQYEYTGTVPSQEQHEYAEPERVHEQYEYTGPEPPQDQYEYTEQEQYEYTEPEPPQEQYEYADPEPYSGHEYTPHPAHSTYVEKPTIVEAVKSRMVISDIGAAGGNTIQIVPDCIAVVNDETPIKQYTIATLRNIFRMTRAEGRMQITNKRVIYRAEGRSMGKRTVQQREYNIDEIAGIEAGYHCRFSILHLIIGLATVVGASAIVSWIVFLFTGMQSGAHYVSQAPVQLYRVLQGAGEFIESQGLAAWARAWLIDGQGPAPGVNISAVSLIIGLAAGFGGIVLFFLLRGKFWLKLIMLGISLGGFMPAALTEHIFSTVLLGLSLPMIVLGLILFSRLQELAVYVCSKEGVKANLVRAKRISIFRPAKDIGYAEAAPAREAEVAIDELGAIIRDVQILGDASIEKWNA